MAAHPGTLCHQSLVLRGKFSLSKHSGRTLQWQPTLGHCVIRAWFSGVSSAGVNTGWKLQWLPAHPGTLCNQSLVLRGKFSRSKHSGWRLQWLPAHPGTLCHQSLVFRGKFCLSKHSGRKLQWLPAHPRTLCHQSLVLRGMFSLSKHSGRKLQWQPTLGHCVIRAWFSGVSSP